MELAQNNRINSLLEFYQPLLTSKQQAYMQSYFVADLSLGEISQNFHVSRQAVYDNLRRTVKILSDDEKHLRLYRKFVERNRQIDRIQNYVCRHYANDRQLKIMIKHLEDLENN